MPCVTFIGEYEQWRMKSEISEHRHIKELLDDVNRLQPQEWLCGRQKTVVAMPLFRKAKEEWRFSLYIDCHGEWQVFNFAEGMSVPENTILAFLLGYRNGLSEAKGITAKEIV